MTVNEDSDVLRYDMRNIKGRMYINEVDVKKQMRQALVEKSEQPSATTEQLNSLKLPKAGVRQLAP